MLALPRVAGGTVVEATVLFFVSFFIAATTPRWPSSNKVNLGKKKKEDKTQELNYR